MCNYEREEELLYELATPACIHEYMCGSVRGTHGVAMCGTDTEKEQGRETGQGTGV